MLVLLPMQNSKLRVQKRGGTGSDAQRAAYFIADPQSISADELFAHSLAPTKRTLSLTRSSSSQPFEMPSVAAFSVRYSSLAFYAVLLRYSRPRRRAALTPHGVLLRREVR